jgi:hypothetical protein
MTTFALPENAFITSTFGLESNTQIFESPLSNNSQILELTGARWTAAYSVANKTAADAGQWISFLTKLRGQANSFFGYDPKRVTAQGNAGGTPLVNGASQTGNSLVTNGWTSGVTNILKAGYMVAFATSDGRELKMITADVNSDGSGNATLSIEPSIRTSPANDATIIVSTPSCVMRLAGDNQAKWTVNELGLYEIKFDGIEVF